MLEADGLYKIRISSFMRYYAPFKFPTTRQWQDEDGRVAFSVRFLIDFQPDSEFLPELKIFHLARENGETKEISYPIMLTNTRCNFGGDRYWFRCPLSRSGVPCRRRVGVLYFNGRYFGCRHCFNLTYASKNTHHSAGLSHFIAHIKAMELHEEMKRYTWRGKDTRKMKRLRKLFAKTGAPDYPDLLLRRFSRSKFLPRNATKLLERPMV